MKVATIINPSTNKQINVILENTVYAKDIMLVQQNGFKVTPDFFNFVKDIVGNEKIGDIDDCLVSIIDTNNTEQFIDPISMILSILQIPTK